MSSLPLHSILPLCSLHLLVWFPPFFSKWKTTRRSRQILTRCRPIRC
jgi:hypothetical protein